MLPRSETHVGSCVKVTNKHFAFDTEVCGFGGRHEAAVLAENTFIIVFVDTTGIVN